MANPFDRFDEENQVAPAVGGQGVSSEIKNPFDVFDKPRLGRAATESQVLMPGESAKPQPQEGVKTPTEEEAGTLDYLVNAFKKGLISSTALFDALTRAGFGQMARAELAKTGALTPEETMTEVYGIGKEPKPMLERALGAIRESQERVSPAFEAIGIEPPDLDMVAPGPISQIAGAAVETLADPASYIGLGAPTKALLAAKTTGRAAGEATTGAAAETAAMLGEEAEKAITGEEGVVGRTVGSLLGATGSAVPRAVVTRTGEDVVSQIMQNRALLKESPEGAEKAYASGAARRLLTAATEAEGAGELQDLIGQINDASRFVNKGDAPLVIAMADNPVIRQQIQRLAITRPEFRKKINDLIKAAEGDVQRKTGFLFGERYAADIPEGAQINIQNIARRRQNLDKELNERFAFVRPFEDTEDFGRRVEALVEQKKKLARAEVAPEYDALLEEARRQDIRMPEEGTQLIYDFVRDNNIRDIFGRGTAVDRRIMSFLKPKEIEEGAAPAILGPEGTPISELGAEQVRYPTLSFDNVESLKKEINLIKRKSLSDSERRKINDLEKIVDEARDTIPGNFSDRLREVDLKYYQKVGVPFSEQGIREIDAKRYAEQIAPVIVKNAEAYRQFVRAVGSEQGNALAERAILNELYEKAAKGGAGLLSPTVVAKYVRDKAEIIDNIPGLREKLQNAVVDDTQLRAEISSLDKAAKEAQKRVADNYLTQTEFPDYESLTRGFLRNPKIRAKLMRDIGDLDANTARSVRNSLRAEIVNAGRKQGNLLDYISAPENKAAIEQLFGPGYLPALRKIALFGDKVSAADVSKLGTQIPKESMDVVAQVFPGLDVPYLSSNFRDRITSLPQKVIRILSKYNSARLQIATDDAIEELLLDPNGVKKLANTISEVNFKFDNPVALGKIAESLSQSVPQATYDALKVTLSGEEQERLQREAREKTSSEMVFGGFEGEEPFAEEPKPQAPRIQPSVESSRIKETTSPSPKSFTWDEVTPEMKQKAARVFKSLGLYETGGLDRISFDRLPLEKRKRFFEVLTMARGGPVRYSPQEEMLLSKYARGGTVSNPTVPSEEPEGEEKGRVARFLEAAAQELPSAMLENVRGYSDLASKYLTWKFGGMPVEDQMNFARSLPSALREAAVNAIQSAKELPEKIRTATPESAGEFTGRVLAGELTDPMRVGRAARAVTEPVISQMGDVIDFRRRGKVIDAKSTKAGANLPDLEADLAKKGYTLKPGFKEGEIDIYGPSLGRDPSIPQKLETVSQGGKAEAIQRAKNIQALEEAQSKSSINRNPFETYKDFGNLDSYIADRPDLLEKMTGKKQRVLKPEISAIEPSFKNKNFKVKFKNGDQFVVNDIEPKTIEELKQQVIKDDLYDQVPASLQGKTVKELIEEMAFQGKSEKQIRDILTGKKRLNLKNKDISYSNLDKKKLSSSKDFFSEYFKDIKDLSSGRKFLEMNFEEGDFFPLKNKSKVYPSANDVGNYDGKNVTFSRKVGDGDIEVKAKTFSDQLIGDKNSLGTMRVSLEALGNPSKGTGAATEMYLEALAVAQEKGFGFASDPIISSAAEKIYKRLIKNGVPFKKGQLADSNAWVLTSDEVANLDLPSIAAKNYLDNINK